MIRTASSLFRVGDAPCVIFLPTGGRYQRKKRNGNFELFKHDHFFANDQRNKFNARQPSVA